MNNHNETSQPKYSTQILTRSVSTFTPAVRMVVIEAWASVGDRGEITTGYEVHPVLGIEVRITDRYDRREFGASDYRQFRTHREIIRAGYQYSGESVVMSPIFLDPELGVISLVSDAEAIPLEGIIYHVATCPWPPDEDEEKLEPHRTEAEDEARAKVRHASSRSPSTPPGTVDPHQGKARENPA